MDDNTLKAINTGVGALVFIAQIVAGVLIYRKQQQTHDLVNGQSSKLEGLVVEKAHSEGVTEGVKLGAQLVSPLTNGGPHEPTAPTST